MENNIKIDEQLSDTSHILKSHEIWHKFSGYIARTFGKDLHSKWKRMELLCADGKIHRIRYRDFNNYKLSTRLVGYDVMKRIKNYCNRYIPLIKFVNCDDDVYSGSYLILIPHPYHGITVMFIPQNTSIQNRFFLYQQDCNSLIKELQSMKSVYQRKKTK